MGADGQGTPLPAASPPLHAPQPSCAMRMPTSPATCAQDVFDANPYKPCHVNNYRILALGAAEGFEAALAAAHAARAANKADPLTYSFLVETALGEVTSVRKRLPTSVEANERANAVWELMRADGVRPSIALCHRMFGVWAQSGQLERAEAAFEEMRAASLLLLRSSSALADLWERAAKLGGDLSEVERQLEATPLLSLGHNFFSYVKIVESCVEAGAPIDKVACAPTPPLLPVPSSALPSYVPVELCAETPTPCCPPRFCHRTDCPSAVGVS